VFNGNTFLADALVRNTNFNHYGNQQSNLHPVGEFVNYDLIGNKCEKQLRFDSRFIGECLVCIYRGILIDDQGNPLLYRKEAEAIAYTLAFQDVQKKAFMKDPTAAQLLSYIKPEAGRLMAAAKIPEFMTQNQWNKVLSAQT